MTRLDRSCAARAFIYSLLLFVSFCALSYTLRAHPLWPLRLDDNEWVRAWLKMTVLDYYGAALALSGIALAEQGLKAGILWSVGFCLLGSPVCCAYMLYTAL